MLDTLINTVRGRVGRPSSWKTIRRLSAVNAVFWDAQYRAGLWDYLNGDTNGNRPLDILAKYISLEDAAILDLGCGTSTNLPLRPGTFGHYHGVDISRSAIADARKLGRPNTSYEVADIRTYDTDARYDAIMLRQVLYYLPDPEIPALLRRFAGFLQPNGKLIIQIYDVITCARSIDMIRACGLPIDLELAEHLSEQFEGVVFVLGTGR